MGDVPLSMSAPGNRSFWAGHVFDPQSPYSRMRASMKPEAKMRGFFHYLAVLIKNQSRAEGSREPILLRARTRNLRLSYLAVETTNPDQELPVEVWPELAD